MSVCESDISELDWNWKWTLAISWVNMIDTANLN